MTNIVRKYKKIFLELKYLYAELEYDEEELKEAQTGFKEAFYEKCKQLNINIKNQEQTEQQNSTDISTNVETSSEQQQGQTTNIENNIEEKVKTGDEEISKLYKKIVSLTHPDSIPGNEKEQLKH